LLQAYSKKFMLEFDKKLKYGYTPTHSKTDVNHLRVWEAVGETPKLP